MKKFVALLALTALSSCAAFAGEPKGTVSAQVKTGTMAPGKVIVLPSTDVPYNPTAEQVAAHERLMEMKERATPAPPFGPHTTSADVARPGGPATDNLVQQVPTDFDVFKTSLINSVCPNCAQSTVNEPSAANSGKTVIETSNWNIAYTVNGGPAKIKWLNQNPYQLSSGFCCDNQIVYDKDRDVFIMLLLDFAGQGASTNGLTLSITKGQSPTSWCTYKFNGAGLGGGATDTLDFPKIAVSNNNLFLTWNDYPPNSGFAASGLARFPLDALAACAGFNYNFLTRNTEFTFALAQQNSTHNQFYWVSNWMLDGTTNGQNLRIFHWADNSGSYSFNTVGVNAYTFGNVACGSPNWCGRLDPRFESVVISPGEYRAQANGNFAGDQFLEVATTAGPSSFSNGNNYVVYNYFKLNSLTYLGNDQTFNTSETFAYPGCTVNERGSVGCAMAQGLNAPGGIVILQDDVNPTQPWGFNFVVGGSGGASAWGDYVITNPWHPGGGPFQTVLWNVNAASGAVQPYYIVWGRNRDTGDYVRWKAK